MTTRWLLLGSLALGAGCDGRLIQIPTTPAGYASVQARDIAPTGLTDANIQLDTVLGPMVPTEGCHGMITFPLPDAAPQIANADAIELVGKSNVVLTIPRERYGEVRDLRANDLVRVRGYASNSFFQKGCAVPSLDLTRRYVWIDTIERLPSAPVAQTGAP